jgi:hypothetical protein
VTVLFIFVCPVGSLPSPRYPNVYSGWDKRLMFLTTARLSLRRMSWLVWSIKCILPQHSAESCSAIISPMSRHQTVSDWLQCGGCWVPNAEFCEVLRFMTRILQQIGAAVISLTSVLVGTGSSLSYTELGLNGIHLSLQILKKNRTKSSPHSSLSIFCSWFILFKQLNLLHISSF